MESIICNGVASSPSNWTPGPVVRGSITTGPANTTCHDLVERYGVAGLPDVRPQAPERRASGHAHGADAAAAPALHTIEVHMAEAQGDVASWSSDTLAPRAVVVGQCSTVLVHGCWASWQLRWFHESTYRNGLRIEQRARTGALFSESGHVRRGLPGDVADSTLLDTCPYASSSDMLCSKSI